MLWFLTDGNECIKGAIYCYEQIVCCYSTPCVLYLGNLFCSMKSTTERGWTKSGEHGRGKSWLSFVWASSIVSKDSTCLVSTLDHDHLYSFRTLKWQMSNIDFYFFLDLDMDVKSLRNIFESWWVSGWFFSLLYFGFSCIYFLIICSHLFILVVFNLNACSTCVQYQPPY